MAYNQMLVMRCGWRATRLSDHGEVLLARSLLSACEADLAKLLCEVQQELDVPIGGLISDGQRSIRKAVQAALPDVSHQLCHFHYDGKQQNWCMKRIGMRKKN
jgi:hypothetical protein